MSRWTEGPLDEPDNVPEPTEQESILPKYGGPWTQQFFQVTIFMTVSWEDVPAFPAAYRLIVPDYNIDAFLSTLNSNGVVYSVMPVSPDVLEGEEPDEQDSQV